MQSPMRAPSIRWLVLVVGLVGVASFNLNGRPSGNHQVECSSILNSIPGVELMRDLTSSFVNRLGRALDNQVMGPFNENIGQCLGGICAPKDPDAARNVAEIIRSRGFEAEEHQVVTRDGYILTVQRIINPLISAEQRKKLKPVMLQHGLMSSSVDWVVNSLEVKPQKYPRETRPTGGQVESLLSNSSSNLNSSSSSMPSTRRVQFEQEDGDDSNSIEGHQLKGEQEEGEQQQQQQVVVSRDSQENPNALGFYLANEGYDVWLGNSRGNVYGQRHVEMSSWNPKFWSFTFDEQIKYDLPDTADYIRKLTGQPKLGYVGHSQGTSMMFGLLADQPQFADVFEPIAMLAPVAHVSNSISPVKYFAVYTPIFEHVNMWFGSSNVAVRYLAPLVCKPELIKNKICANLVFLGTGFDIDEFDTSRVDAYMAHMPSGTSVKNIAHYGQEVLSGRFAHFDHGLLGNQMAYGQARAPDYDLSKITSKSLVLFTAENDWLASPKDVAKLRAELKVPLFRWHNITEDKPNWNHIDFTYGMDCGQLVNKRIVEAFHHFD